jgi:ribonuclease VapC
LIADTSALVAVLREEDGREALRDALLLEEAAIPAPVLVELRRVTARKGNRPHPDTTRLQSELQSHGLSIEPFTSADADSAAAANERYGTGNGRGGTLNLLDLMVYAVAIRTGRPILCTGRDFAATDAPIHPASRLW